MSRTARTRIQAPAASLTVASTSIGTNSPDRRRTMSSIGPARAKGSAMSRSSVPAGWSMLAFMSTLKGAPTAASRG